jgi:uncharacterized protein
VRTDFILSAEIIVIALRTAAEAPLLEQFFLLSSISVLMTVGAYGLVAGIVKLDDVGLGLRRKGGLTAATGRALLAVSPQLMKSLAIGGTIAMFLVGGTILSHGIAPVTVVLESLNAVLAATLEGALGLAAGSARSSFSGRGRRD